MEVPLAQFVFVQWLVEFLSRDFFFFEWDEGNKYKSERKHGVLLIEVEEAFYDEDLLELGIQILPEVTEERFGILAKTFEGKILFICFTVRNSFVRVISARKANNRERELYEKI